MLYMENKTETPPFSLMTTGPLDPYRAGSDKIDISGNSPEIVFHTFIPDNSIIEPEERERRNERMMTHLRQCAMNRYINRYAAYKQWTEKQSTNNSSNDNTVHGQPEEGPSDPTNS